MTAPAQPGPAPAAPLPTEPVLAAAGDDAVGAAAGAGVTIQRLTAPADLRQVAELFARIWDAPDQPPLPHDLLRSLAHAGGAVHAAFRGGQLAGAAAAVFGAPATASCYSLIAGVSPGSEGRGCGLALKLAQREWALRAGAVSMTWTFDPLLRRNAWFNLARLGARVTEYLVDFYGEIADGVNDPETDRLTVCWDLRAALPARPGPDASPPPGSAPPPPGPSAEPAAPVPVPAPTVPAAASPLPAVLVSGPDGEPVPHGLAPLPRRPGPALARCWIPADILTIRHTDPGLARRWRLAQRAALGGALSQGYRVTGLTGPGWYLLARDPAPA